MLEGSITARPSRHIPLRDSILGLSALFLPAAGFIGGLVVTSGRPGFVDLADVRSVPIQLWTIGACGIAATVCGVLDWHYHAVGKRVVSKKERHGELIALGLGGAPLFLLMMSASCARHPATLLVPIVIVALFTTVMICMDEFVYHRRSCSLYETTLHRVLVFGNGTAWLAWMHWIFARG